MTYKPVTIDQERGKAAQGKDAAGAEIKAPPDEAVSALTYEKKIPPRRPPEREPVTISRLKTVPGPVTINVNRMQLPEFVIYVLGETLKIPFVMDQGVMTDRRVVTLQTPQALTPEKALEMVIGVLEKHELHVEERAGSLYVMQKPPAPRSTSDVRIGRDTGGSGDVVQIIPLRHVKAGELDPLIKDVARGGVQVKPYARENVLILHGNTLQMRQIIDFIDHFDVPSLQAKKLMLLRLTYWPAEEFVVQMTKILEGMSFVVAKTPRDPGPLFVPVRQMNGVLVVAPDEATMKYILEWKEKLDTVESAGSDEKAYMFSPQYSRASDLVNAVLRLYGVTSRPETGVNSATSRSGSSSTAVRGTQTSPTGSLMTPSGAQSSTSSGQSYSAFGGAGASQTAFGAPASFQTAPQAGVLADLKITADNNKNVVIMICSPAVYRTILGLLRQLDTQTKQVLIEATIAELSLTDELKFGFEWYVNNTIDGGPITGGTMGNLGLGTLGMTFKYVTASANFAAMLNAFARKDKANILSTPRLTVLDNHEAFIQVGQDVPIATGEQTTAASTSTNPTIQRSIEYRSLGIILRVKPTINTEGLLTLEITQEVSDLSPVTGVGDSPIILVRKVNTSVVAAHGQTVALGGLMRDRKTVVENKVPFLGDIPLIGHLFKVNHNTVEKTELLVLVTPTILTNTEDATKITDELKKEIPWIKF
jgi:general secretion pathway protein D